VGRQWIWPGSWKAG